MINSFTEFKDKGLPKIPKESIEYLPFWKEVIDYCRNGITIDGFHYPGDLFFYTNFWMMEVDNAKMTGKTKGLPTLRDLDWYIFECVAKAARERKGMCLVTGRGAGKTYSMTAKIAHIFTFFANQQNLISAGEENDLVNFVTKLRIGLSDLPPELKQQYIKEDWNKQVVSGYKVKDERGVESIRGNQSIIWIRNYANNVMAANGTRPRIHIFEEAGKHKNLIECYNASTECWMSGDTQIGIPIIIGTGGDMEKGTADFCTMFYNPDNYNLISFDSRFVDENDVEERGRFSVFIPAQYCINQKKSPKTLKEFLTNKRSNNVNSLCITKYKFKDAKDENYVPNVAQNLESLANENDVNELSTTNDNSTNDRSTNDGSTSSTNDSSRNDDSRMSLGALTPKSLIVTEALNKLLTNTIIQVTNYKDALDYLVKTRQKKAKQPDRKVLYSELQYRPIVPKDAFLITRGNMFNLALINEQLSKLKTLKEYYSVEQRGDIKEENGQYVWVPSRTGKFKVYEHPVKNVELTTYSAGCDPYNYDQSTSDSKGALFIFKNSTGIDDDKFSNAIVAEYIDRPPTQDEFYYNVYKLLNYYNTRVLHEDSGNNMYERFQFHGWLHKLIVQPVQLIKSIVPDSKAIRSKRYGLPMTTPIKEKLLLTLQAYVEDHCDKIYSVELLSELAKYDPDPAKNFDAVMAAGITLLYKWHLEQIKKYQQIAPSQREFSRFEFVNGVLQRVPYVTEILEKNDAETRQELVNRLNLEFIKNTTKYGY